NDRRQSAYAAKLRLQEVEDRTTELIEKTREYNLARETAATAVKEAQVWLAGPKSTASTDSTNADEQESKLKSELGAQVLELVEEDCSLDEWLLGLDDALKSNSIDIEAYLREIRSTSRKQFEVRALRQKAVTQLQAAIIYKEEQEQRQRPSATTAGPSGPTINSYPAQSTGYVMAYPAPRWG
ncbi:orotate phosphoribosyltransferase, partial [Perkinsus olseni]